jgi:flagellar L-ring protein precursor FlgH
MSDNSANGGRGRARRAVMLLATGLYILLATASSASPATKSAKPAERVNLQPDTYDELFAHYLDAARRTTPGEGPNISWMVGLAGDRRARAVNDLLTVQVVENISATGTADSTLNKSGKAAVSVPNIFGVETKLPSWINPAALVNGDTKTDFKGGGTTSRAGTLTAVMTVRVAEVLPNGDLVLEGAREIDINGDRQMVVLTGVARPSDVTPANTVLSTQVGQLRIRYFGRGLMKDNLQPGWLIRVLNKIF